MSLEAFRTGRYAAFTKAAATNDPATMAAFYHKTGVLVNTDAETAVVGREEIKSVFVHIQEHFGKTTDAKTSEEKFLAAGDFIFAHGTIEGVSEKLGPFIGEFIQVWRKDGDEYYIYHDEFNM